MVGCVNVIVSVGACVWYGGFSEIYQHCSIYTAFEIQFDVCVQKAGWESSVCRGRVCACVCVCVGGGWWGCPVCCMFP